MMITKHEIYIFGKPNKCFIMNNKINTWNRILYLFQRAFKLLYVL